ncbi:glycosyl hydrolase [Cytophagales bacterium WSM2-2]|nr:glycosyl hydrolase [Cytophagales bacterium WSM2-2]
MLTDNLKFMTRPILFLGVLSVLSCTQKELNEQKTSFVLDGKKAVIYVTADSTQFRITRNDTISFQDHGQPEEKKAYILVDPSHSFQTFMGIGGAITDASAETFAKLPTQKQEELLNAYYNTQSGIGYTLARTNINSCDFSSGSYTYVNEGDSSLKSFEISHDQQFKIPLIKKVMKAASGQLALYVSPWSPPAWMKSNNDMLHGGKLKSEYYQSWANYYSKFIHAYEADGVPVWGLTVQNEPMANQKWESCIYTAEEERDFVKNFLGPTLKRTGLGDKKLIVWDHNRDLMYQRAQTIFSDPAATKYIWGMGFHWYEDWSGGDQMFVNVKNVHETFPDQNLIFTEGCLSPFTMKKINDWSLGERYGRSMINDFNNGTVAWTDWNILLDETGGPNHVKNFCMAPIHAVVQTGELLYTNSYYYIGHFSKFIKPGAKRVQTTSSRTPLLSTAFVNPDGSLAAVVMNPTSKRMTYYLWIQNKALTMEARPHSIVTCIIQ